jgi:hypothetical protein
VAVDGFMWDKLFIRIGCTYIEGNERWFLVDRGKFLSQQSSISWDIWLETMPKLLPLDPSLDGGRIPTDSGSLKSDAGTVSPGLL